MSNTNRNGELHRTRENNQPSNSTPVTDTNALPMVDGVMGAILSLRQVCKKTALSRSGIYAAISKGSFPPQVRLSPRRVGWYEPYVDSWIRNRIKGGDANQ